jgi:hypothetical protein
MIVKKGLVHKILAPIGWAVLFLFIILTAIFSFYRLRGPIAEERAALVLIRKSYYPLMHGINAFPLLFYMRYDVPDNQLDAQMAIDIQKVRKRIAEATVNVSDDLNKTNTKFITRMINGHRRVFMLNIGVNLGGSHLPMLSEEEQDVLCSIDGKGCLAKVSANPGAVSAALAAHPVMNARAQALEHTDFYWNEFPADFRSPKNYAGIEPLLWLSAFALRYAQGDHVGALAATCRNIAAWRRMMHGSNSLSGVASIHMDEAIRLYADMLAALPADQPVPEDCALALQPVVAADMDRCAELARRYAMFESLSLLDDAKNLKANWIVRLYGSLVLDLRKTLAWTAQILAASCGEDANARLLADEYPRRQPVRSFLGFPFTKGLACIANLNGCLIVASETPLFNNFDADRLDHAAHLRLAATLLWLRDHPGGGSIEERFERRPAELRSPHHDSWFDAKDGILYVENFDKAPAIGKQFGLPVTDAH